MANADRPKGFRPAERAKRERPYVAAGTIYPGDAVKMDANGAVVVASASNALLGVAAAYATSGQTVLVWDDPDQLFEAQCDDGTSIAQTNVGLNFNIIATAGSSTYRQSRMEVDADSGATDSTLPLRMLQIKPAVDNAAGEFAKVIVKINAHQLRNGSEGL